MANPLPSPFRQTAERLTQQRTVPGSLKRAGLNHSHDAVGSKHPGPFDAVAKMPRKSMQHARLAVPLPKLAFAFVLLRGHRLHWNEWIADGAHPANSCRPQ